MGSDFELGVRPTQSGIMQLQHGFSPQHSSEIRLSVIEKVIILKSFILKCHICIGVRCPQSLLPSLVWNHYIIIIKFYRNNQNLHWIEIQRKAFLSSSATVSSNYNTARVHRRGREQVSTGWTAFVEVLDALTASLLNQQFCLNVTLVHLKKKAKCTLAEQRRKKYTYLNNTLCFWVTKSCKAANTFLVLLHVWKVWKTADSERHNTMLLVTVIVKKPKFLQCH